MKASGDIAGIVPYLSRYYTVRVKLFSYFYMCYLYEAYYKPITAKVPIVLIVLVGYLG